MEAQGESHLPGEDTLKCMPEAGRAEIFIPGSERSGTCPRQVLRPKCPISLYASLSQEPNKEIGEKTLRS